MALCHFLSFFSPTPKYHPKCVAHPYPLSRSIIFSCSAEKASKKGRSSKPTKSDDKLRVELLGFISAVELPEDRVPTMKELSEHGRKDLANIVRRRGYKVITELLGDSKKSDSYSADPSRDQGSTDACIDGVTDGSSLEGTFMVRGNGAIATDCSDQSSEPSELCIGTLQIKAANFVQTGKLDLLDVDKVNESTDSERESDILSTNGADTAHSTSQLVSTLAEDHPDGDVVTSGDRLCGADLVSEVDNQAEIDHLKAILHQKEMELYELKQQLEKEKQALCILQAKANTEIENAHREITEKDAEFQAMEESLSGLKEVPPMACFIISSMYKFVIKNSSLEFSMVQIDYWGNGETVEVAGSFNGWHHRIKMDLVPSNTLINSPVSRNSKLWSTVLWLYPGVYEIKFIVDGDWRIDPNVEIINNGYTTNNVLRVDR